MKPKAVNDVDSESNCATRGGRRRRMGYSSKRRMRRSRRIERARDRDKFIDNQEVTEGR